MKPPRGVRTLAKDDDACEVVRDGDARACITHWRQWHGDTPCPATATDPEVET